MIQQLLASQWLPANQEIGPWIDSNSDPGGLSTLERLARRLWPPARKFYLGHPEVVDSPQIQNLLASKHTKLPERFPREKMSRQVGYVLQPRIQEADRNS